jgi:hypothetical protein
MNDITLQNVQLTCDHGSSISDGRDIVLRNVQIFSHTSPALETYDMSNLMLDHVAAVVQPPGPGQASAKENGQ